MNLTEFKSLFTNIGRAALDAASRLEPKEADFLSHFTVLSRDFPRDIARAALEIEILRGEAAVKFNKDAPRMYFTRESLEQASPSQVAEWRVRRYKPFDLVLDLGCSIGGDTVSLARREKRRGPPTGRITTVGVDGDPLRLAMARANAEALGLRDEIALVNADLESALPIRAAGGVAVFFDPSRRREGRRAYSVDDYQPPLVEVRNWMSDYQAIGVKVSPAVRIDEVVAYGAEIEFVSLDGEMKEAVLWFGPLKDAVRRATVLPGAHSMTGEPDDLSDTAPVELSSPRRYLCEPDPAVIRAGLVRTLARSIGAAQIDRDIAFLTADRTKDTPFARYWPIEDVLPFHLKRLRAYLRERNVGKVTIKKRGSPLEPTALARDLRLKGGSEKFLVLTHVDGKPVVIVCPSAS